MTPHRKQSLKQLAVYLWCMGVICVGVYGSFDSRYKVVAFTCIIYNIHYFVSGYYANRDLIEALRLNSELKRLEIIQLESKLRIAEFGLSIQRRHQTHSPN